jgi:hypothetical protein
MRAFAIFFGIGVLLLAAGGMYYFGARGSGIVMATSTPDQFKNFPANLPTAATTTEEKREVPAGYKEYRSERYWFSLLYPEDFEVSFFDEGAGAGTITIQNVAKQKGFQIFVVPYSGNKIPEERFREDEPSGVRENDTHVTIDGAGAESFYSKNARLGDTAEIWFISHGLLYEVTTLKPLAPWLSSIMSTWKFL